MNKKIISSLLLVSYCILLIQILVFKNLAMIRVGQMRFNFGGTQEGPANLIPFKTILYYIQGNNGLLIGSINILGNIIALVPLGFLLPFIFKKLKWKYCLMIALATGLAIEITQVILKVGIFDIDDVILNGLGVIIGFWKFNIYSNFSKTTRSIMSNIVYSILGSIILLYTLSYYKIIQLPFGIEPSIGKEALLPFNQPSNSNEKCCDLCGGSGGTGIITALGNNAITIKRKDGVLQNIKLTDKTVIKFSKGLATRNDLTVNKRVTLIIDDTETATLVLICGIQ